MLRITDLKRFKTLDRPLPCRHLGDAQGFWLSFLALFGASFSFFLALNASFPAETINIAKVRLERPLSNETALARARSPRSDFAPWRLFGPLALQK